MKVKIRTASKSLLDDVAHRINPGTEKIQFHASDILTNLKKRLKRDAFCLIGVSMTDLYP